MPIIGVLCAGQDLLIERIGDDLADHEGHASVLKHLADVEIELVLASQAHGAAHAPSVPLSNARRPGFVYARPDPGIPISLS
ncbi:hypothetical protein [Catelliglobosispora koreensis]|uniref:hypothetical protein n=1 Tax=Catelliglobosispora koreensis TaxID=129052 RepID=UPI00058E7774|nr:hypothetical protein [Catelliglobosispora koreensis]